MIPRESSDTAALDKAHLWHPFTQHRDWNAPEHEPLVLVSGQGALLRDSEGREYLDGNSSIWTNLHGHRHPKIGRRHPRATRSGRGHTPFSASLIRSPRELARELVTLWPANTLTRVFFSDDGSTAMEVGTEDGGAVLAADRTC